MSKFRPGQSANEVHHTLKSALKNMAEAEKCAVICFGEIMDRKLYRELGYSSINQYAEIGLEFSASRTRDFVMLSKRLKNLPVVKEKMESGKLGYTMARVIVPVLDKTNEAEWVNFAATHTRRELETEVKRAKQDASDTAQGLQPLMPVPASRPAAVIPVRVSMEMTPTQFARYETLWAQLRQQGGIPADKIEALLEIMQSHTAEKGPRGPKPPVQIHIHQCEDCEKASIQTSRGELKIGPAELEQAQCDCQSSRPGERNTTAIPPATRRLVMARYRHKCQQPGCRHTRYLQVHHKKPRSLGGSNNPDNLTVLCQACHKLHHEQSGFFAKSPTVVYKWRSGATTDKAHANNDHNLPKSPLSVKYSPSGPPEHQIPAHRPL